MGIRLIVSSINSVTENISSFLDAWMNPLVQKLPSYIKDSTEFIKLVITTPIPPDSILVSIDVSSLYTIIPHKDGIVAANDEKRHRLYRLFWQLLRDVGLWMDDEYLARKARRTAMYHAKMCNYSKSTL